MKTSLAYGALAPCMIVDDREVGMTNRATMHRNSVEQNESSRLSSQRATLSLLRSGAAACTFGM